MTETDHAGRHCAPNVENPYRFNLLGQPVEAANLIEATRLANAIAGEHGKPGRTYRVHVYVVGGNPVDITAENLARSRLSRPLLFSAMR